VVVVPDAKSERRSPLSIGTGSSSHFSAKVCLIEAIFTMKCTFFSETILTRIISVKNERPEGIEKNIK